jgi:hypothetical protein
MLGTSMKMIMIEQMTGRIERVERTRLATAR